MKTWKNLYVKEDGERERFSYDKCGRERYIKLREI